MNIFLVLHPSGNYSVPGSLTWYRNFYEPLTELGHTVFHFDLQEFSRKNQVKFRSKKYRELLSEQLPIIFAAQNSKTPFDLFLSYVTSDDVFTEALQRIKAVGVPMANFSCNNTHQFHLVDKIAPFFDFSLHSEKAAKEKFLSVSANPFWFQMAANPKYYHPVKTDFKYEVSFVGSAYGKRIHYVNQLNLSGIRVDCFGPNWLINRPMATLKLLKKEGERFIDASRLLFSFNKSLRYTLSSKINYNDTLKFLRDNNAKNFHYPVTDNELPVIFNQSKINLGFLEVFSTDNNPDTRVTQHIHLREFEVPMSGGLYITNYSEELAEFYLPDQEVLIFRNEMELADKIRYYLKHDTEREKVRVAGHRRAIQDHSYQVRFTKLFKELQLDNK